MRLVATVLILSACSEASELGGKLECTPGEMLIIGCSERVGRNCSGRPIMSLCDGTIDHTECTPETPSPPLIDVDRPPDCPQRTVTCPASGSIAVGISQGGAGLFTCTWDYQVL